MSAIDASDARPFVLVVGAGPTGLLLAVELQRRGVPNRVIDANPGPLHWDRATVVHPRSLEAFDALGIAERFVAAGTPQRGAKLHSDGQVLGALDFSGSGSRYHANLGLSEEVTESILAEHLRALGGTVARSSRLVELTPRADGARAVIEHDGERHEVDAAWVVGCDGIHSPTRTAIGVDLQGHDIDEPWAVFDATIDGWTEAYDLTFVYLDSTPVILTALPDRRWRVYLRPTASDSDLVADANATLRAYYPSVAFDGVENPTRFHCHSKVATEYRSGRVLLAGDAAHLCSPAQGHGMNTGLQDATNLGWKLALVHQGAAAAELLDSYGVERRGAATTVADSGDEFDRAQTLVDPAARAARDAAMRAMVADPDARHHEAVAEAELNVDYSASPIVAGDTDARLGPGARLPDDLRVVPAGAPPIGLHALAFRAGHTVLLLGAASARPGLLAALHAAVSDLVDASPRLEAVVTLGDGDAPPIGRLDADDATRLGVEDVTLLAVRPDGYVGLRADRDHLQALEEYDALIRRGHH